MISKFKFSIIMATLALLVGVIYAQTTAEVYQAVSEVLILRPAQETNLKTNEEARNRWIWARDGLALRKSILNDKVMSDILKLESIKKIENPQQVVERMITIEYTGADEFAFKIQVKGSDKKLILEINKILFNELKHNYLTLPDRAYNQAIKRFEEKAITSSLKEKLVEIKAIQAWESSVREETWKVIKSPQVLPEKVWPRKTAIVISLAFMGLILGMFLDGLMSLRGKSINA